jgi:flavin reductase (DIM6/NTAB) family NADH-FMN oxidoreductase RutF
MVEQNLPFDIAGFRAALGAFPTGVTVVTALAGDRVVGFSANSFTSVSLDPPLLLWCIRRASARHSAFTQTDRYAISVLAEHHGDLCSLFAKPDGAELPADRLTATELGPPAVRDALAVFECEAHRLLDGGDHSILLGRVVRFSTRAMRRPLVFCQGRLTALAADPCRALRPWV